MAGVAGVPVVVARVAVEQGVSAATDALHHAGTRRNRGHVFSGNCRQKAMLTGTTASHGRCCVRITQKAAVQGECLFGEHALKRHQVEDLVDGVVCSYDTNVPETYKKSTLKSRKSLS